MLIDFSDVFGFSSSIADYWSLIIHYQPSFFNLLLPIIDLQLSTTCIYIIALPLSNINPRLSPTNLQLLCLFTRLFYRICWHFHYAQNEKASSYWKRTLDIKKTVEVMKRVIASQCQVAIWRIQHACCTRSIPIENLVQFRNRVAGLRTGCLVLEPDNDYCNLP